MIHAVTERQWHTAISLLEAHWPYYFNAHLAQLLDVLSALPPHMMAQNPRLRVGRDYLVHMLSGGRKTRVFHEVAADGAARTPMDRFADLTAQSAALRSAGRFGEAAALVDKANDLLGHLSGQELREVTHGLPDLQHHWGLTRELAGQHSAALREYTSSFHHAVATGHMVMQSMSAASAAWIHALAGRTPSAKDWLSRIPTPGPEDCWLQSQPAPALFARTLLAVDALDIDAAQEWIAQVDIQQAIERWSSYRFLRAVVALYGDGARAELTDLEAFVAEVPVQQATSGSNAAMLALARHALYLALGQSATAERALHDEDLRRSGTMLADLSAVIDARWLAHAGQLEAARRIVVPLIAEANAYPRVLIPALFIAGMGYRAAGDKSTGNRYILDALHLVPAHGPFHSIVADKRRLFEEMVAEGVLDASILERVPATRMPKTVNPFAALTSREHETLLHAVSGRAVAQIAERMFVSPNTVKSHLRSVYRKLGVTNRDELVDLAQQHGYRTGPKMTASQRDT
ncbi:response regulator transcription factor [Microbacterium sp.]|uniref:helix-turn-helix transcriptional regulator n=1 Tax=Microbacterium sp. TaxID=51671 RepID=UPI003A90C154